MSAAATNVEDEAGRHVVRLRKLLGSHAAYQVEAIGVQMRRMASHPNGIGDEDGGTSLVLSLAIRLEGLSGVLMELNAEPTELSSDLDDLSLTVFGVATKNIRPELLA